jgi:hypothetical protein
MRTFSIRFSRYPIAILSLAIFVVLAFLCFFYELNGPSQIIAIISATLYVGFGIILWFYQRPAFTIALPIYIGQLAAIISNAYLEGGTFISEQMDYSYATGSTLRLSILAIIFMLAAVIVFSKFSFKSLISAPVSQLFTSKYFAIFAIATLVFFLNVTNILIFGSPIFMGIQRFDYWAMHPLPQLHKFTGYLSLLCFYLGSLYGSLKSKNKRKLSIFFLVSYIFINILVGEKFTGIYLALLNFFIGFILSRSLLKEAIPNILKIVLISGMLFLSILCLVIWSYTHIHGIDSAFVFNFLISRIFALQGHVWWGIDRYVLDGHHICSFSELINSLKASDEGSFYMLMNQISPSNLVNSYMNRGVTFTMGSPAIAIYVFGYFGAIIYQLLGGIFYGLIGAYLFSKLKRGQIILSFIALKLLLIMTHIFNMGIIGLFLSPSFLLYSMIMFGDIFFSKVSKIGKHSDTSILSSSVPSHS